MPDVGVEEVTVINLRTWCKEFHTLPFPGGPLEQPAWLMEAFNAIDAAFAAERKRKADEAQTQLAVAKLKQNG